jgi:hypothetical protein
MSYYELAGKRNKINPGRINPCMRLDRTDFTTQNMQLVQEEHLLLIVDFFVATFIWIFLTLYGTSAQVWPRLSHCWALHHTQSRQNCSERLINFRIGRYLHNAQQTQATIVHAFSRIWTRNPSTRATSDLRLGSHGHRDWLEYIFTPRLISLLLTARSWLKTGTSCCLLWSRWWTFKLRWWNKISWLAELLLESMETV